MTSGTSSFDLSDQFIREYQANFDITLEDVMSSFLWMEIEHNKKNFTIHLDTYIQETLAEYKATVTRFLRGKQKQVPMQPRIMLERVGCPESLDPMKVYRSYTAKLPFAASWVRCDNAFIASQLARFCASAGP